MDKCFYCSTDVRTIVIGESTVCVDCLTTRLFRQVDDYTLEGVAIEIEYALKAVKEKKILTELELKRKEFKKVSKRKILERDAYRCKQCGSYKSLHVDHIVPLSRGGTNDTDNLQALCAKCNLIKGNK